MPPITTVANGLCTSAPMPVFSAMGTNPRLATNAVINTGRKRIRAPSTMLFTNSPVSSKRCLMNDSITNPFNTAIPDSAINPTDADMDKGISLNQRDITPPVNAKGIPVKIINASRIEPNAITSIVKITNNVTGTTIVNR